MGVKFDKRKMNSSYMHIIRLTGRVIACYEELVNESPQRVPTDIYDNSASPDETNTKLYYIFGTFEQMVTEEPTDQVGLYGSIKGTIVIPNSYKKIVNKTAYFDPYLNGSKFLKDGAALYQSLVIIQSVKALYLPDLGELQQGTK